MKSVIGFSSLLLLLMMMFQISCSKELSCENCKESKPPIANAGADQITKFPKDSVTLDGTLSSDPDGIIVSYKWAQTSGPLASNIVKQDTSKTLVKTLAMGVYKFELTVVDNVGLSAKDTVQVIVIDTLRNQPPVANAGTDQVISLPPDSTNLSGILSFDPDGTITSYQWSKIAGPPSFTMFSFQSVSTKVDHLVQGIYQFELKVTDNGGLSSNDTVMVTVNGTLSGNIPPICKAGKDTIILSSQTSCTPVPITIPLNGNSSYDPDGAIVAYLWSGSNGIVNPNAASTTVSGLVPGTYPFVLKVTDNLGAIAYDTVHISIVPANRPLLPAQLTLVATLPQPSTGTFAVAGNKLVFAGGGVSSQLGCVTARVDIYNLSTAIWSTAQLSVPREGMGVAMLGNKLFLAGGFVPLVGPPYGCALTNAGNTRSNAIDIYDASANTWSTAQLSSARVPVGAAAGNKVVFASGDDDYIPPAIDINNTATNTWSTSSLAEVRHIFQAAVTGNKIYFGGGSMQLYGVSGGNLSKKIDIYDASSDTWSTDTLSKVRGEMGAIAANNKIYWGGGFVYDPAINDWAPTNSVEIKDLPTNTTTFDCLCEAKSQLTAMRKDDKIIFFGGQLYGMLTARFDIYDLTSKSWSIGVLPDHLRGAAIASFNNVLYVTNGLKVWKLDF
jgi:hypothetical protein